MSISSYVEDFKGLFFPNLCLACDNHLPDKASRICLKCQATLPYTDFHLHKENNVTERFWGRVPIITATAGFYFTKSGRVQRMIHRLKYDNRPEIGVELGKRLANKMKEGNLYDDIDLVLPVPMHPKKEFQRGYNQAAKFAEGLSENLGKPWLKDKLVKKEMTMSQTKKSREDRFENVSSSFVLESGGLSGRHILLVDDVITTGATLEACATVLLKEPQVKVSIAAIALAGV